MKKTIEKKITHRIMTPIKLFMGQEKSGGIVLGVSVLIALLLANTGLAHSYFEFFEQQFGFVLNGDNYLYYSLHHWINDGLMAVFFFLVGLELKREFIGGELANPRNTILPIAAAIGGMLVPAAIYALLNPVHPTHAGWGIPMATDIAFALGVVYLLGNHVPASVKLFLTTLAIVDDLGAVIVIALFYTSEISLVNLGIGFCFLTIMFAANKLGIKNVTFYVVIGFGGVWTAFLLSGIHATIAAVLAAFMIPADTRMPESIYQQRMKKLLGRFDKMQPNGVRTLDEEQVEVLSRIREDSRTAIPPLQRLEHSLNPLVSFVVMPIFAISNAGISFTGLQWADIFSTHAATGVALGLILGKPIGVIGATLLLAKSGISRLPQGMTVRRLMGVGCLAAIGFTMSIFVSTLAFNTDLLLTQAKIGIFAASIIGGIAGAWLLHGAADKA